MLHLLQNVIVLGLALLVGLSLLIFGRGLFLDLSDGEQ